MRNISAWFLLCFFPDAVDTRALLPPTFPFHSRSHYRLRSSSRSHSCPRPRPRLHYCSRSRSRFRLTFVLECSYPFSFPPLFPFPPLPRSRPRSRLASILSSPPAFPSPPRHRPHYCFRYRSLLPVPRVHKHRALRTKLLGVRKHHSLSVRIMTRAE